MEPSRRAVVIYRRRTSSANSSRTRARRRATVSWHCVMGMSPYWDSGREVRKGGRREKVCAQEQTQAEEGRGERSFFCAGQGAACVVGKQFRLTVERLGLLMDAVE